MAGAPGCFGERATIVGTNRADVIVGARGPDVIVALGGNDTIRSGNRGDLICAGRGDDVVRGGRAVDLIFGEQGDDRLFGQLGGFNQIVPGPGDDFVDAGPAPGDEVIYLDAPNGIVGDLEAGLVTGHGTDEIVNTEWLIGSEHDDTLIGFLDRHDVLFGAGGNDSIDSNGTDDPLFDFMGGGAGDDTLVGGSGIELLVDLELASFYPVQEPLVGPLTVDLVAGTSTGYGNDTLTGIDGSEGSPLDDVMIGNDGDNAFFVLLEGNDTVDAGGGNDLVDGGDGADDLDGGPGTDVVGHIDVGEPLTIDLTAGTTSQGDVLAGFEDVFGTFFDDTITGDAGPNRLEGDFGNDTLFGLAGDDLILGDFEGVSDGGVDTADGGEGTDACDAETETACEADPPPPAELRTFAGAWWSATRVGAYR